MAKSTRPTEESAIPDGFTNEPIEAFKILVSAVIVMEATADWIAAHSNVLAGWGAVEAAAALENMASMVTAFIEEYHTGLREMDVIPPYGMAWKELNKEDVLKANDDGLPF